MTLFRRRDLLILAVIIVSAYISWDNNNFFYSFQPTWYIDKRYETRSVLSNVPLPLIVDLDGNNDKEIILINYAGQLKILSGNVPDYGGGDVYTPTEKYSYDLIRESTSSTGVPVLVETGYIQHYSDIKERSQIIVILSDDLKLMVFDSTLQLLWEKQLSHKLHKYYNLIQHFTVHEAAIHIIPLNLKDDIEGTIILGVSMKPRDSYNEDKIKLEYGLNEDLKNEHRGLNLETQMKHFTWYALNPKNGDIIWRHDGLDIKPEQFIRSLPINAQKLNLITELTLQASMNHGMNDWSMFRQSLLNELPHIWNDLDDTSIRIAHFIRRHIGAGAGNQLEKKKGYTIENTDKHSYHIKSKSQSQSSSSSSSNNGIGLSITKRHLGIDINRFSGLETPPVSLTATLPHDAIEHTEHPNVLVAHTSQGVEVVSLTSGTPITSLTLLSPHIYDDLDGDGVLDHINILETQQDVIHHSKTQIHDNEKLQHCMIVVSSGIPTISQLFNGTICQTRPHLHDPISRRNTNTARYNYRNNNLPLQIKAATPVIYQIVDPKTLLSSKYKHVAVAINTGFMTSYSSQNEFRWQTDHTPTWSLLFNHSYAGLFDTDANRIDETDRMNTIESHILVVGEHTFALVATTGDVLTVTDLPNPPITRPIIGDFNNDGITDLIIITEEAILGYRLEIKETTKIMFISLMILTVIAIFCFILNIRSIESTLNTSSDPLSPRPLNHITNIKYWRAKYGKSVLTLMRSTDDHHLD